MARILTSNFIQALRIAIHTQREQEKEWGYTRDSSFVAGLQEILDAALRGETIKVSES